MPSGFAEFFLPELLGAGAKGFEGGLAGLVQGQEYRQKASAAALDKLLKELQIAQMKSPQYHALTPGQLPGTVEPLTGRFTPTGPAMPMLPRPLAPSQEDLNRARTQFYQRRAQREQEAGTELRPTSRIAEVIDRKKAAGLPLTEAEQAFEKSKLQEKQTLAEILSGVRAREKAQAPPSFMERKYLAGIDALANAQKEAMRLFDPKWVGPFAGRLTAGQLKTGVGLDPGQARFVAKYSSVKNRFIHELYGSALTAGEIERAIQQFPELTDPPEVFREKMLVTADYIEDMKKAGAKGAPRRPDAASTPALHVPPAERFQQLLNEGMEEEAAYETMAEEGY